MEKKFIHTYQGMKQYLIDMEKLYKSRIRLHTLGITADKREIIEASLGYRNASRHILIHAAVHGREYGNTALVLALIEDYLQDSFQKNHLSLIKDVCFHLIPMVNPDGVVISQQGPKGIQNLQLRKRLLLCRKRDQKYEKSFSDEQTYFRKWKANARGVDINRNFNSGWKKYIGSPWPSFAGYKGKSPESEKETQALLKAARRWSPCCCISFHSCGNLIYWNYGCKGKLLVEDKKLAQCIGKITGYDLHSTINARTQRAGCSDYFMEKLRIPSVTIETGSTECPLPIREYSRIYRQFLMLLPALAFLYGK